MFKRSLLVALLLTVLSLFSVAEEAGQVEEVEKAEKIEKEVPVKNCEDIFEKCIVQCGDNASEKCEEKCDKAEIACNS